MLKYVSYYTVLTVHTHTHTYTREQNERQTNDEGADIRILLKSEYYSKNQH